MIGMIWKVGKVRSVTGTEVTGCYERRSDLSRCSRSPLDLVELIVLFKLRDIHCPPNEDKE
jgi:hypothetical protein